MGDRAADSHQRGAGCGAQSDASEPVTPVTRDEGEVRESLDVLNERRPPVRALLERAVGVGRGRNAGPDPMGKRALLAGDVSGWRSDKSYGKRVAPLGECAVKSWQQW